MLCVYSIIAISLCNVHTGMISADETVHSADETVHSTALLILPCILIFQSDSYYSDYAIIIMPFNFISTK